ncbi:MAG: Gfo/Idh/MocA family oxidoreductase [Candidatus Hydrogenedentes bacterium]|nr:Gfo/Idh/MocA family oxidoreductase [Candidatus Hydrogenedentota bacterium]
MPLPVAFVGFHHGHAFSLYRDLEEHPGVEIVAACEEDPAARDAATGRGITITHTSYEAMLREVPCEAVACCEWYGMRGPRLIQALEAGKHVICDKPLCVSLDELARMEKTSESKHLKIGCQLPMPYHSPFVTARTLIVSGAIGEVQSVTFNGAHALNYEGRPSWMFDEQKYGGTINDIAVHGIDALPWLTGRKFAAVIAARTWSTRENAATSERGKFKDGGVVLFTLDNGGAAYGDVSWLSPEGAKYGVPFYWRFTVHGDAGALETSWHADHVALHARDAIEVHKEPLRGVEGATYIGDWLLDIANTPAKDRLHTERIIASSRVALLAQHAADSGKRDLPV